MSTVRWAPDLPEGWNGASLRWLAEIFAGGTPNKDNLAFWTNGTIPWLNSGSVNDWSIKSPSALITSEAYAGSSTKWIPAGSVMVALAGQGKTKGMAARLEIDSTCNQSMAAVVPGPKLEYRFLQFWLSANYQNIRNMAGGDKRDGLNLVHIGSIEVPLPPLAEQQAIADYLDSETQRIDELIAEQRGLIETLRERRMAAIDAEVHPGDLAEWTEMPLRYSLEFQEGPGIGAADFHDSGVPLLRISSIRGPDVTLEGVNYLDPEKVAKRWDHFRVETGDLLINSSASMGSVAEVLDGEVVGAIPYTGIIKIRPRLMTKEFARWYFQSRAFLSAIDLLKTGSTIQHYGPSHLRQLRVFLPQADRQKEIAERLTRVVAHADSLIAESEDLIALSQERRAALITAAVTGQIDVRSAA